MGDGLAATAVSGSPAMGQYGTGSGNTIRHSYGGTIDKNKNKTKKKKEK